MAAPTAEAASTCTSMRFLEVEDYQPPAWASGLSLVPQQRVRLAMLPTPIHRWHLPGLPPGVEVFIKRDDLTGMQASGNKIRKLEFLMAEAKAGGHDCVITIGGIQSNHCRATAVVSRYLGLDCHLILRMSRQQVDSDPGLVGNLLVDRLTGAEVHKVTKEEYARCGSEALVAALEQQLRQQRHRRPYAIPVGGSNSLGTWGYMHAVEEIRQQAPGAGFTDIAMACGSGGTSAGLALGAHLAGTGARVTAYAVCDDEDYFYDYVQGLIDGLGAVPAAIGGKSSRELMRVVQAKGLGYALSSTEELEFVRDVGMQTGVVLDPVYSGKAVLAMVQEMQGAPAQWRDRRVLFVHTGGLLGMYDKLDQLQPLVQQGPGDKPGPGAVHRMQVPAE